MDNSQSNGTPRGIFGGQEESQNLKIPDSSWFEAFYKRKYEREIEEEQLFYPYKNSTRRVKENIRGIRCTASVPELLVERKMKHSIPQDLEWVLLNKLHPSTEWVPQLQYLTVNYQEFT